MHIGIEAQRANNPVKTGVEHYAHQLILHLAKIDSSNRYTLYLRSKPEQWFFNLPQNFITKVIPFPKFWTQLRISWEMLTQPTNILFIPASALPVIHPKKSVITIHDTAWIHYPEAFTWFMRTYLHWSTKFAVRSAAKVIAVSQATKQDLIKFYNTDPDKVVVVPHGYEKTNRNFSGLSQKVEQQLPEKYILFLSTLQPRKNLEGLIDVFRQLKTEHPELPHKLVVVGKLGWKYEPILKKIQENSDIVVYLGRVDDSDRWPIYHRADLFIHPSFYEGFGMWILEAFECGVPVAVSNISSLPEVGGDAALYFDPHDREQIKQTILKVLQNRSLAEELVKKGYQRLDQFGWDKCARQTLTVFESLDND